MASTQVPNPVWEYLNRVRNYPVQEIFRLDNGAEVDPLMYVGFLENAEGDYPVLFLNSELSENNRERIFLDINYDKEEEFSLEFDEYELPLDETVYELPNVLGKMGSLVIMHVHRFDGRQVLFSVSFHQAGIIIVEFPFGIPEGYEKAVRDLFPLPYSVGGAIYTQLMIESEHEEEEKYEILYTLSRGNKPASILARSEEENTLVQGRRDTLLALWLEAAITTDIEGVYTGSLLSTLKLVRSYFEREIGSEESMDTFLRGFLTGLLSRVEADLPPRSRYKLREMAATSAFPSRVRKGIANLVSEIGRSFPPLPKEIQVFGRPVVTRNYIWYAYHSMNHLGMRYKDIPSIIEYLYMYARAPTRAERGCTAAIRVDLDSEEVHTRHGPIRLSDVRSERSLPLLKDIHRDISQEGCKIHSVFVVFIRKNTAHITLLMFLKSPDVTRVLYYDPHGSKASSTPFMNSVILGLIYVNNSSGLPRLVKAAVSDISCERGTQSIIEGENPDFTPDKFGYCLIFSLFWVFCLLRISQENPEIDPYVIAQSIESTLLTPGNVPTMEYIIGFAQDFTQEYVALCSKNPGWYERFHELMREYVEGDISRKGSIAKYLHNSRVDSEHQVLPVKREYEWKEEDPLSLGLDEETLNRYTQQAYDLYMRKHDREPCERDEDCASDFCVEVSPGNRECVGREDVLG